MTAILIIEDNPTNLKLARALLAQHGYDVLSATNADDGLALALESLPALVLMDVQLPGTDGLTATRLLRAQPLTKDIPVVALTAHAMRGDEKRILAAGCDAYVAKPLRYKELLEVVKGLIASGRSRDS